MQHLEKSTNLLCIDARQALHQRMQPQTIQHELPRVNVEESEEGDLDLEEEHHEGGLVDLDLMPAEVEVEGLILEAERVEDENHDAEEDAHRTGMAP